jgi:catechol 2,3-dioxygenase-like lactoylglutathione lyase family enzyme
MSQTAEKISQQTAVTQGVHHLGLTVPDLQATRRFFIDTLGYEQVGEVPEYPAVFLTDSKTMITLWQVKNPNDATAFDRNTVIGLHHLALSVESEADLRRLHALLVAAPDVDLEFAPQDLMNGALKHLMCNIPGGIRVEFVAPAA